MIKLGTSDLSKAFVGSSEVSKMYLGSDLVYNKEPEVLPYDAEIEYLESTGTQWINTSYIFADNFGFEIDFQNIGKGKTIIGANNNGTRTAVLFCGASSTDRFYLNIGTHNANTTPFYMTLDTTKRHKVKILVNENKASIYVDDVQKFNNVSFSGNYISNLEQTVFCTNYGTSVNELALSKVFSLKMWQDNSMVRDYIPVRLGQVGYLYDKVSGNIFGNSGTGSFILGNNITV